jgi:hypothetical protein
MIPFPPVIEKSTVKDAFITEEPRYKQDPHALEVPWMTGITSEEGAMKSARKFLHQLSNPPIQKISNTSSSHQSTGINNRPSEELGTSSPHLPLL